MNAMTDWIDFAVYAIFLFALYFAQPTAQQRLIVPLLADRNAEWVAGHADMVRRIAGSRWRLWVSYALGTASLALLGGYQLGLWHLPPAAKGSPPAKWMILWELSMAALMASMLIGGLIGAWRHVQITRLVPLAPRRQATLELRTLDSAVPRWLQLAVYALAILNLAAWTGAGIFGWHSSPIFWARVGIMFMLSGFFFWGTRAVVARRANVMDRILGPANRTWEIRMTFATQILPPLIGALRLYEEVTATQLLDLSRLMQLALAIFLSFWLLSMCRLPVDLDDGQEGRTSGLMPARG